ncbi:right-handed parallel beta-helix repeat-containing protein [Pluralibacter gergoviae]
MFKLTRRKMLINLGLLATPMLSVRTGRGETSGEYEDTLQSVFPDKIFGRMVTLTEYMTSDELADANSSSPILDHSEALNKALKISKMVFIPPVKGYYRFKDVDLDDGVWLIGSSKLPYFPKNEKNILGCGSAIVMMEGGKNIFKFNNNVTLFGLLMYGSINRDIDGIGFSEKIISGKVSNLRLLYCGFYSFRVGIGHNTKYIKADVNNCIAASNITGVKNLVDSKIFGGCINANRGDGVYFGKGANDNILINLKSEWNKRCNFRFEQSINNILSNSICDRAGMQGIKLIKSQVIIDSCVLRRNGALVNDADFSAHIWLEGEGCSFLAKNVKTLTGKNDDRSGMLSPMYTVIFAGDSDLYSVVISDSDLSGAVLMSFNQKTLPKSLKLQNNIIKGNG